MATNVIMPKLGMAMKEGMVGKWVLEDGAKVTAEDIICILVTKKITYELKAQAEGILKIKARTEVNFPIGTIIGWILAPGEAVPEDVEAPLPVVAVTAPVAAAAPKAAKPAAAAPPRADGFVVASPAARAMARQAGLDIALVCGSGPAGRVTEEDVQAHLDKVKNIPITPAARKLAEEKQVDITQVKGSGPGGRITEDDINEFLAPSQAPAAPAQVAATAPQAAAGSAIVGAANVPFSGMRAAIAENMMASVSSMAHVTIFSEIDVTELVALRERLKKSYDLTYTDLIVKAVAIALRKHPRLNASLVGEEIVINPEIHVGVGVALDEGLIVPVIRNTDQLTIQKIGERLRVLAAKARSNSLEIDEAMGSTFSITNLGAYGVDGFTPIVNPPEIAILGVGRIIEKPAIYRGEICRRSLMVLSLTFDHRLVDGAPAAAFLQSVSAMLSTPFYLGNGEAL